MYICNIGDSRCIHIRSMKKQKSYEIEGETENMNMKEDVFYINPLSSSPSIEQRQISNSESRDELSSASSSSSSSSSSSPSSYPYIKNKEIIVDQLTIDHKPDLPNEKKRIQQHNGRVCASGGSTTVGIQRVWLMNVDEPGLAMSRSIGDDVSQSVGVICTPEINEVKLGEKEDYEDEFMLFASDGVW